VPFETMSGARATASVKASAERGPRKSSHHQARKPVPSRLVIYLLFGLLVFCPPYVLAAEIAVCFTPEYGMTPSCTQQVVDALTGAKKSVLVQAYSFTSAPIAKALMDAQRRGVQVKVILDRSNRTTHYSAATFLAHAGIPVWIDARHAIAHNKIMSATRSCSNDCSNAHRVSGTSCSITSSPPAHAALATAQYEAAGTMHPRPQGHSSSS
jgi:phosphatidylserine/phosphatidylglycerophosphate/cardiolipin synthase-like enzyme